MKPKFSVTRGRCFAALLGLATSLTMPAQQTSAPGTLAVQYTRSTPRNITGTVQDGSNEPLRGAVVQVEQEGTMTIQSFVTDERGLYHFRNLNSETDYHIWATFRGHQSKHHEISRFDKKPDRAIPLVIDLTKD